MPDDNKLVMSMNLSDIAILNIKGSDYCCIISLIRKSEAIKFCKTLIWLKKVEHYKSNSNFEAVKLLQILI